LRLQSLVESDGDHDVDEGDVDAVSEVDKHDDTALFEDDVEGSADSFVVDPERDDFVEDTHDDDDDDKHTVDSGTGQSSLVDVQSSDAVHASVPSSGTVRTSTVLSGAVAASTPTNLSRGNSVFLVVMATIVCRW
jgi:hypothetical protein